MLSLSPRCSPESLKDKLSSFSCPLCCLCWAAPRYLQNPEIRTLLLLQELVPGVIACEGFRVGLYEEFTPRKDVNGAGKSMSGRQNQLNSEVFCSVETSTDLRQTPNFDGAEQEHAQNKTAVVFRFISP